MAPSERKLYLVMKAFCVMGSYADAGWIDNTEDDGSLSDYAANFDFMPASVFDGFGKTRPALAELCRLPDRTFRRAQAWLLDNGLMHFYAGEYHNGLAFPHRPGLYVPKVLEALELGKAERKRKSEERRTECTGHAKKAMRALKVHSVRAKAGKVAGDPRLRELKGAAITEPELIK